MNTKIIIGLLFVTIISLNVLPLQSQEEEDKTLRLPIGDERYKDKTLNIFSGEIHSARSGKPVTFSQMVKEMQESSIVYVGESHDNLQMHDIQFKIIQALYNQDKNIAIGIEMFPVTLQEVLNKWSLGLLSREEFIEEAEWYVTWNFNFKYYEKIFEFAKKKGVPLYALNIPRKIISKIRMRGWEALTEEEKKLTSKPSLTNQDHRTLIRTIFESADLPHQMRGAGLEKVFESLYRAQSAWDEVMAANALEAIKKDNRKMIVLAGSGHLIYNLGINLRAYTKSKLPFKTVVCLPVPGGEKGVSVSRSLADYIYGIDVEEKPVYPSVGLGLKKFDNLKNLVVERDPILGVAKGKDFKKGDIVLSVDEKAFYDINRLRIYLSKFTWDDTVTFRLLREAQEKEVKLKFQIMEEDKKEDEKIKE